MLLSIVIPVYNVEPYLKDLVESVAACFRRRADRPIEAIFVDDRSTDDSMGQLQALLAEHDVIDHTLVTHARNRGLSAARNSGLDAARGTYVWFVDSDDIINSDAFNAILDVLDEGEADVVLMDFCYLHAARLAYVPGGPGPDTGDVHDLEPSAPRSLAADTVLSHDDGVIGATMRDLCVYAWSFVFRRGLFDGIAFPEGRYFEDIATVPSLLLTAQSFKYVQKPTIFYRQREGSIMRSPTTQRHLDLARAMANNARVWHLRREHIGKDDVTAWEAFHLQTVAWAAKDLALSAQLNQSRIRSEVQHNLQRFNESKIASTAQICQYLRSQGNRIDAAMIYLMDRSLFTFRLLGLLGHRSHTLRRIMASVSRSLFHRP